MPLGRLVLALTLAFCVLAPVAQAAPERPNFVFVLADDLSWDLVQYMPNVQQMQSDGATFTNYFVTNSLCCPSRASILTGEFPHDTGVLNNTPPLGGFSAFRGGGAEQETVAVALKDSGYRTAYLGKYLNGYKPFHRVPPGWSNWAVPGSAYDGFTYSMNVNGRRARYGASVRAYVTDVLSRRAREFTTRVARADKPFLLMIAPFAPHRPYVPAPRHSWMFPGLKAPRTPAFGAKNAGAPGWLAARSPLTPEQEASLDRDYRLRAQSVQAVDEAIGRLREQLELRGEADNTYVIFSSDNGYHLGEHRLVNGKMTAFDSDIRVPLVVTGPGIEPGTSIDELAANIDLAPTLMRLAGLPVPRRVDGQSLVPLLRGRQPVEWRDAVLVEHFGPYFALDDPDRQTANSGNPPTYDAIRTRTGVYIRYETGEREYYDHRTDPHELDNVWDYLSPDEQAGLDATLSRLVNCHDARSCMRASQR